jgi:chaperonin cofactor prefoldin
MTDGTNEQAASAVADLAPADAASATLSPFQTHPGDRVCRVVEVYSNRWEGKRPGIVVNTPLPLDPGTKPDVYVNVFLDGTRDSSVLHAWRGRPEGNTVRVLALAQHDDLVALPAEGDWYVARMPFIPPSPLVARVEGLKVHLDALNEQDKGIRGLLDRMSADIKAVADAQGQTATVLSGFEDRLAKISRDLSTNIETTESSEVSIGRQATTMSRFETRISEIEAKLSTALDQITQLLRDSQSKLIPIAGTVKTFDDAMLPAPRVEKDQDAPKREYVVGVDLATSIDVKPATPDALAQGDATANETATAIRAEKTGTPPDDRSGPQDGSQ